MKINANKGIYSCGYHCGAVCRPPEPAIIHHLGEWKGYNIKYK